LNRKGKVEKQTNKKNRFKEYSVVSLLFSYQN